MTLRDGPRDVASRRRARLRRPCPAAASEAALQTAETCTAGFASLAALIAILAWSANTLAPVAHAQAPTATPLVRTGLTAAPRLVRVYDAIFDAQFERVPALIIDACGPPSRLEPVAISNGLAPREACQVLDLVSLWWQLQLDPGSPARDADFRRSADATIAAAEAWTVREPRRAEAWFYLGGAYGARVQFRAVRGEQLAAARDGKRIKDALEEALRLDPGLQDAFFGIGLYHYYADVAPTAAKILRRLLFLPGGDRNQGLREMQRARERGLVVRDEATYQLHLVLLWYEHRPEQALQLVRALRERHPRNPHFTQRIAEIEDVYLSDSTGSLRSWETLLDAAVAGRVAEPRIAEAYARLGLAKQLDRLYETDRAIDHLKVLVRSSPTAPYGALAQAHLQLAEGFDRLGLRSDAVTAYRAAVATSPAGDPLKTAARARVGLRSTPASATTRAYRLSLEGWRALERGAPSEAEPHIALALALAPLDSVTRYRQGRLSLLQKNDTAALTAFEGIVAEGTTSPPSFYAAACVEAALIHERRGDTTRAIDLHRLAVGAFGADRRVAAQAGRALERLGASTTAVSAPRAVEQ
jgi:tetratricopeptide (TPR) repeat protein